MPYTPIESLTLKRCYKMAGDVDRALRIAVAKGEAPSLSALVDQALRQRLNLQPTESAN